MRPIRPPSATPTYPGVFAAAKSLAAIALCAAWGTASAAPCAGFSDVDASSPFCVNLEWVRNRAITNGCTTTTYCPDLPVSRLHMAAFLNRLGTALTPVQLRVDTAPGAIDLDANAVVCATGDFAVTGFPRRAFVDLAFNASAVADVVLAADLALSVDGGATWANLNTIPNRGSVIASQWGLLADIAAAELDVGKTVRFGAKVTRGGVAGATDLADSRCQMRVLIHSRDGTASPF